MKHIARILTIIAAAGAITTSVSSCGEKFLDEVQRTKISSDFLNTPEGLYSMSESLYLQFRQMFYAEGYWAFTNAGTDEFMIGGDGASEAYNTYDSRYSALVSGSANTASSAYMWNMLYLWLNRANEIIDRADVLEGSSLHDEAVGTAYFVRAFDFLFLVNQHGDIPLVIHAAKQPEREYGRDPREDVYKQLISDLEKAYELLPSTPSRPGKITKTAAAHYLACAHLWRASECNDDWNSSYKTQDLQDVIKWTDIVIAAHPLTANFEDVYMNFWLHDTSITETNSEIILRASHTVDSTERGNSYNGNMTLCWFVNPYQNAFSPFCVRDVAGGRSYQRMKATPKYTYFLYDLENDSRFWKSFKTTWAVNQAKSGTYTLPDGTEINPTTYFGPDKTEATFSKYLGGMYIINREEYGQKFLTSDIDIAFNATVGKMFKIKDYNTGKYIPVAKALLTYASADAAKPEDTSMSPNKDGQFTMLAKYLDGAVSAYNAERGSRDVIIARSTEDYFFKAEALIRQGKYNEGFAVLKPLRERAQFKAGEERDKYMDGGQGFEKSNYREALTSYTYRSVFYGKSSYFYSVGGWDKDQAYRDAVNAKASVLPDVTEGNYPKEDLYVMNYLSQVNPKYGTDTYTRAMCYLLNEKSREMYGEFKRYNDLVRTRTLADRLYFNDQCWTTTPTDILGHTGNGAIPTYTSNYGGNFKPEKHYLRPIPLDFLEKITKDGHVLTQDERNEMQNPGYAVYDE